MVCKYFQIVRENSAYIFQKCMGMYAWVCMHMCVRAIS